MLPFSVAAWRAVRPFNFAGGALTSAPASSRACTNSMLPFLAASSDFMERLLEDLIASDQIGDFVFKVSSMLDPPQTLRIGKFGLWVRDRDDEGAEYMEVRGRYHVYPLMTWIPSWTERTPLYVKRLSCLMES